MESLWHVDNLACSLLSLCSSCNSSNISSDRSFSFVGPMLSTSMALRLAECDNLFHFHLPPSRGDPFSRTIWCIPQLSTQLFPTEACGTHSPPLGDTLTRASSGVWFVVNGRNCRSVCYCKSPLFLLLLYLYRQYTVPEHCAPTARMVKRLVFYEPKRQNKDEDPGRGIHRAFFANINTS